MFGPGDLRGMGKAVTNLAVVAFVFVFGLGYACAMCDFPIEIRWK